VLISKRLGRNIASAKKQDADAIATLAARFSDFETYLQTRFAYHLSGSAERVVMIDPYDDGMSVQPKDFHARTRAALDESEQEEDPENLPVVVEL
jgi:hypothetical protein